MRHLLKRFLSLTAASVLMISSLSQNSHSLISSVFSPAITASAAGTSGTCGDNARWAYDEATNTLTITGKGPMYDFEPTFEPIVPIPWGGFSKNIKKIVIGSGITTIGKSAFENCSSVTEVYIPDGVTSIGWNSFTFCYALTSVRLPQTLTSINNNAFTYCRNLTEIVIPDSVTNIGPNAFDECTSLRSVKLPASLQYIFAECFRKCPITQISIPSNVRIIGEKAFEGCLLTTVTVPASVKRSIRPRFPVRH